MESIFKIKSIQPQLNKVVIFFDQLIISGAGFLNNIILAKGLGIEQYGVFSSIALIQLFILSLFMGFCSQVLQVVYGKLSNEEKIKYHAGLFYLIVLTAIILIAMGLILSFAFNNYLILIGTAALPFYLLQEYFRKLFLTSGYYSKALYVDSIIYTLQSTFLCVLYYYQALSVPWACSAIAISFIPSILPAIFWLKPGAFSLSSLKFAWAIHQKKSGWLVLSALLQWLGGYFFVMVAGWWIGAAALGALRIAQYLFGVLNILLQSIENYILPKINLSTHASNYQYVLTKKMLLIMLPIIFLMMLFAKPILAIAGGEKYMEYAYVMYGLGIVYVLMTLNYPVRMLIRSHGLEKEFFNGYLFMALFSLISAYTLLRLFNLYGVLIGLGSTQLISYLYWGSMLNKKTKNQLH
jgi:O-antigen/teichoic acid export membrane protein